MRRRFLLTTFAADVIALAAAGVVASLLVYETHLPWYARLPEGASIWPLLGLLALGALAGSYVNARAWKAGVPRPAYGRAFVVVLTALLVTSVGIVLARIYWSRPFLVWTTVFWLVFALGHRAVRRRRPWNEPMVVISSEKQLIEDLAGAEHARIIDVIDPAADVPVEPVGDGATLVIDLRAPMSETVARFVSSSSIAGYPMRAMVNVYEEHTGRLALVHVDDGWEVSAWVTRNSWYVPIKRVLDVISVAVTAPLWLTLGAIIGLAVRIDSSGPIIYRQPRVGYQGKIFTLYKFRTMVENADAGGARFAQKNDHRLTRVGQVLRRFRVDEIPQLWNVLRGDLSLVGPRPEQAAFVEDFKKTIPFYDYRHLIRPGVTGWAQVTYGYADDEADTIEKLTYDLYYMKHMSPWMDLQILGSSIWTVLSGFGAR